jgi:hypothetical protein
VKNGADDPRIRLLNRLYARKRKELHHRKSSSTLEGPQLEDVSKSPAAP